MIDLVDAEEEIQVKFTSPPKTGTLTIYLRSDSYWDFDQFQSIHAIKVRGIMSCTIVLVHFRVHRNQLQHS